VAVLGGAHLQRTMYLIGDISDGDRSHDGRIPGVLEMNAS